MTSKNDVMRACGRWPFPFLRNGDYLTPAFTGAPPCARFVRRLAHSHGSLRYRPRWGLACCQLTTLDKFGEVVNARHPGWANDAHLMCERLGYATFTWKIIDMRLISARAANALTTVDHDVWTVAHDLKMDHQCIKQELDADQELAVTR